MRLIITRHGETLENIQGIVQGHLPGHLSEKGKEQAKRVAERLRKKSEFEKEKEGTMTYKEPKTGETLEDFYKRAGSFLHKVIHKHKNDTVLFVGHNGIDKAIIGRIMNKSLNEMRDVEMLKNTSINIFDIDEDKNHKIILFNCIKHLA